MFCPACGAEFISGTTECPDCAVALVEAPPAGPEHDLGHTLTVIDRFHDSGEAQLALGLLQANGIEASLRDENLLAIDWFLIPAVGGIRLAVPADQAEEARLLLQPPAEDLFPAGEPADEADERPILGRRGKGLLALLLAAPAIAIVPLAITAVARILTRSQAKDEKDR